MKKLKLFLENFLIYGVGGIISRIIPLLMVPIVARLMPDSAHFGVNDMTQSIVSFTSAIAILGMYDAMYRMFFEKESEEYKKDVCSTALTFTLMCTAVVCLLMLVLRDQLAQWFLSDRKYANLIYITIIATFTGSTNSLVCAPTRMQNKRKVFLILNTVSPILSYSISIPLLLHGHYLIALPVARMISGIVNEVVFWALNHKWFSLRRFNPSILKALLVIALPLFPNFLIYWVFNSSDKLMITNMLDIAQEGIYSVGSKLGHASQLIYTAFAGGWQYFAFSTMKENDQVKSNSNVFEYLGIISFSASLFVFALCEPIYKWLFPAEYLPGHIISPYLFLAPLMLMLFQVASSQFIVVKKTWPNFVILTIGALANLVMNYYFIPLFGIEGASVATLLGYVVTVVLASIALVRMKLMVITPRFIAACAVMTAYILLWRFVFKQNIALSLVLACAVVAFFLLLYSKDILTLVRGVKQALKSKKDHTDETMSEA